MIDMSQICPTQLKLDIHDKDIKIRRAEMLVFNGISEKMGD
jgi:hypothetical protein|tara:strand:- start:33 stop:155 length:123 start_codon:yes stop_codon:yes gene_type:complete